MLSHKLFIGAVGVIPVIASGSVLPSNSENRENTGYPADNMHPNIILILADDLGYGDLGGYYGGQAKTPHLSRLAQEGMLFTDFHSNGPTSSPTRVALLTGRYQQRSGIERYLLTRWESPGQGRIKGIGSDENKDEVTMAEYLRKAGYVTGIFGKWHLGNHLSSNPVFHGFDEFRGLTGGCGDYFSKLDRFGYPDWWHNEKLAFQEGYTTNVITENSVRFIKENRNNPFFLYISHLAIHFPWQTPEDDDLETRREGEEFTSNYPGPQSKLGPHPPGKIPETLIEMIEHLDQSVGLIIETLREQGLDKNTLVFFTSDNGGYLNYPVSGDIWPEVGSNGPLRGQKTQVYEGGHRVPAIAWWPGRIPALSVTGETVMTFDLLPTFMDLSGIKIPSQGPNAIDGVSILPLLLDGESLEPRTLFWRAGDQKAVRSGYWKLVISEKNSPAELYNLADDIGESFDLSDQYPEMVRKLKKELQTWEKDVD